MTLLAEITRNPAKIRRYMARLDAIEAAIASAERSAITKPPAYSGTASGTYSQAEVQAVMDQLTAATTTARQLADLLTLILSDLREVK